MLWAIAARANSQRANCHHNVCTLHYFPERANEHQRRIMGNHHVSVKLSSQDSWTWETHGFARHNVCMLLDAIDLRDSLSKLCHPSRLPITGFFSASLHSFQSLWHPLCKTRGALSSSTMKVATGSKSAEMLNGPQRSSWVFADYWGPICRTQLRHNKLELEDNWGSIIKIQKASRLPSQPQSRRRCCCLRGWAEPNPRCSPHGLAHGTHGFFRCLFFFFLWSTSAAFFFFSRGLVVDP